MSVPFYRIAYAQRRNNYCHYHMQSQKKDSCDDCRKINTSPNTISIYEIGNGTERGEMLDLAALLEYQVACKEIELIEARYQFIEQYPQSNCLPTNRRNDVSVLNLIIPFYDTVLSIPNRKDDTLLLPFS